MTTRGIAACTGYLQQEGLEGNMITDDAICCAGTWCLKCARTCKLPFLSLLLATNMNIGACLLGAFVKRGGPVWESSDSDSWHILKGHANLPWCKKFLRR